MTLIQKIITRCDSKDCRKVIFPFRGGYAEINTEFGTAVVCWKCAMKIANEGEWESAEIVINKTT